MIDIIGEEEHENQDYQIQTLEELQKRKELNLICSNIEIEAWHTWYITFNRKLTYIEEHGIQHILSSDSLEQTNEPAMVNTIYKAWWD